MLDRLADVLTIVVLGSSVFYTLLRVIRAIRERIAAAGTTKAIAVITTSAVAISVLLLVLIWQVAASVSRASELDSRISEAHDRIMTLESTVAYEPHVHSADYDSNWVRIQRNCRVYPMRIGFGGLPEHVTAYYRINEDIVVPWGMNQAGHSNGALLDFDGDGILYVRLPCGNNRARQLDFGSYRSRDDERDKVYNDENVEIRILLWKMRPERPGGQ